MSELLAKLQSYPLPLAQHLGIVFTRASTDEVEARLPVRKELCTRPDILHGGAVMALADTAGAAATVLNLPAGQTTTTLESKTNFIAAVPMGDTAIATTRPIHKGRTTMVWETRITRESDGRLAAVVIQSQLVMAARG